MTKTVIDVNIIIPMNWLMRIFTILIVVGLSYSFALTSTSSQTPSLIELNRPSSPTAAFLISPYLSASPGTNVDIGIQIQMEEGWHTYWKNAGDIGKPLEVIWKVPSSIRVSPLKWPRPQRILYQEWTNFGYKNKVTLYSSLKIPTSFKETELMIEAEVSWLVCSTLCRPFKKKLELFLPIGKEEQDLFVLSQFQKLKKQLPRSSDLKASFVQESSKNPRILLESENHFEWVDFFPLSSFAHNKPLVSKESPSSYKLTLNQKSQKTSTTPKALVVFKRNSTIQSSYVHVLNSNTNQTLFWFILLAFLGGLILNIMPCVLPVLFLKFYHISKSKEFHKKELVVSNLFYSLGIVSSFLFLGLIVYFVKKGGSDLGWGFQMQSPIFVMFLALFFTLIATYFLGWLSFHIRTQPLKLEPQGLSENFLTGILITVSASPCTVPFMGAAIAYGLSQPPFHHLLIFISLGLGMSSPFLLLSFFPQWIQVWPSGSWSEKLKKAMSIPMFLTTLWLAYILHQLKPSWSPFLVLSLFTLIVVLWLKQRSTHLAYILLASSLFILSSYFIFLKESSPPTLHDKSSQWLPFNSVSLDQLRSQNKAAILLNFTADWCLTCQWNDWTTFNNKEVQRFLKEKEVILIQGDWTKSNPEITRVLKKYGRAGIPFTLFFPKNYKNPVLLPEILSPKLLKSQLTFHL